MKILRPALAATLAAGAATALAMAVGVSTASADSTPTSIYGPPYDPSTGAQQSYVAPMHAGDCNMFASLFVSRPDSSTGFAKVRFHFVTSTSRTSNFDQWHNSWKFYDSFGQQVDASGTTAMGTLDGLRMPTVNATYDGAIETTIKMNSNQWDNIKYVLWTGAASHEP